MVYVCPICGEKFGSAGSGAYSTRTEGERHMTLHHPGVYAHLKHKREDAHLHRS